MCQHLEINLINVMTNSPNSYVAYMKSRVQFVGNLLGTFPPERSKFDPSVWGTLCLGWVGSFRRKFPVFRRKIMFPPESTGKHRKAGKLGPGKWRKIIRKWRKNRRIKNYLKVTPNFHPILSFSINTTNLLIKCVWYYIYGALMVILEW